jgi:hypothetical protein
MNSSVGDIDFNGLIYTQCGHAQAGFYEVFHKTNICPTLVYGDWHKKRGTWVALKHG